MRSRHPMLRAILILVIIFVGVGLLRGWFYVSRPNDADNSKMNVQFTVDTEKVKEDSTKVQDAAGQLGDQVANEAKHLQDKVASPEKPKAPPAPLEQSQNPVS